MGKVDDIKLAINNAEKGISKLTPEVLGLPAFNTHKIKHLLNNLGSISTKYLECGLHKAGGFVSALYRNELIGVGIDNWTEFEQDGLSKRLAFLNCAENLDELRYAIRESDCFSISFGNSFKNQIPINNFDFYTYDAGHGFEQQYQGVVHFLPFMANEFILCIDDTEWEAPRIATLKAIEDCKLEVLFHQHLFDGVMGGTWWNGFDVYLLKKAV